jgi:hypothetical protein
LLQLLAYPQQAWQTQPCAVPLEPASAMNGVFPSRVQVARAVIGSPVLDVNAMRFAEICANARTKVRAGLA